MDRGWVSFSNSSDPTPEAFFSLLCDDALSIFKSLSADNISLHVLDLTYFPINTLNKEEQLLNGLVGALEQSCESLQELSLPVQGVYAKALAEVTLKNLKVIEFVRPHSYSPDVRILAENEQAAEEFLRLLQALDGHADRPQKETTISELRLPTFSRAPFQDAAQSDCSPGLFNAIRTIRVEVVGGNRQEHDSVAAFLSLFPKLECLCWNGVIEPKQLRLINSSCADLQELHFCPYLPSGPLPGHSVADDEPRSEGDEAIFIADASTLDEIFAACQGKLRGLAVYGKLSIEQIKHLGETNPALQHVEMEIGLDNVKGLELLLGTFCRQMQTLNITLPGKVDAEGNGPEEFGTEGWQILQDATNAAADSLREITINDEDGLILHSERS